MKEKELAAKAGEELDERLKEAKKTGNLVVKDAVEDEETIRSVFEKEREFSGCSRHLYREDSAKRDTG